MALSDCAYCLYQFRANLKEAKPPIECRSTGKPCLGCDRQQDLHTQIEATKKLLDKLIIEEHNLRTRLNLCHDPIQRLPLEITSYIFSLTLSDFVTQKSVTQRSQPRYARHLWKTNERTPLTLGAVCQKWRAIAWSTCHLWSDLMLALHNAPTEVQIDVVRDWIQRSQSLPLKIRLFFEDIDEDSVDLLPFKKFAGIFNGHSARWETLSVYSPTWISVLFVGNEYGAPLLKTLELAEKETKIPVGDFALAGPEPQPTSVNFAGYHRLTAIAISWNNVTHARFDTWRFSLDNYLELFRRGINLIRLHFHVVDGRGRPTGGTFGLPIQHQLQDLLVSIGRDFTFDSERPFYPPLFDTITLPSLKHLTIDGPATESLGSVKQFLARSSPPLKSLNLTAKCDQQHALDLLYDLPSSLKNIKLDLQGTTAD